VLCLPGNVDSGFVHPPSGKLDVVPGARRSIFDVNASIVEHVHPGFEFSTVDVNAAFYCNEIYRQSVVHDP
jgi:hypothetical protein